MGAFSTLTIRDCHSYIFLVIGLGPAFLAVPMRRLVFHHHHSSAPDRKPLAAGIPSCCSGADELLGGLLQVLCFKRKLQYLQEIYLLI